VPYHVSHGHGVFLATAKLPQSYLGVALSLGKAANKLKQHLVKAIGTIHQGGKNEPAQATPRAIRKRTKK